MRGSPMSGVRMRMGRVRAVAAPYWAGEAEIIRTYFRGPRTRAQDLFWLRAQAYKEARPFRDLPEDARAGFLRTGAVRNLPGGSESAQRIAEETRHFRLLAALVADCFGVTIALTDDLRLPEDRKLQEMRAAARVRGGELGRAAVAFTEGGGGAMFQVLSQLDGGEFERKVASVFKIIAAEETFHGPAEIFAIARHAESEADWGRARTVIRDISRQRVLMRNEMFGHPLGPARIAEILAGNIQPWPPSLTEAEDV
jgi:hypothetical protein